MGLPLVVQDGEVPCRSKLSSVLHPLMKEHITQSYRYQLLSRSVMKYLEKQTLLLSFFLSCPRKSPKANSQLTAETRWKKAPDTGRRCVSQVGQHQGQGTTKPPACISSRFLVFTNLHFMPPCSKHKQKPRRAFSCCHRNSYYNLNCT